MLQQNELRIGNIFEVGGNWWHVDSILSNGENDFELYFRENDLYDHSANAKPIHITPEVLAMCGFIKYGEPPFFSYRLKVNSSDELAWYSQDCELRYQTIGSGFTRNFNIKYLHQLQNLVFALTGQELKISDK